MSQRQGEFHSSDFLWRKGCFFSPHPPKLSGKNSPSAFLTLSFSREFFATENEARRLETAQGADQSQPSPGGAPERMVAAAAVPEVAQNKSLALRQSLSMTPLSRHAAFFFSQKGIHWKSERQFFLVFMFVLVLTPEPKDWQSTNLNTPALLERHPKAHV